MSIYKILANSEVISFRNINTKKIYKFRVKNLNSDLFFKIKSGILVLSSNEDIIYSDPPLVIEDQAILENLSKLQISINFIETHADRTMTIKSLRFKERLKLNYYENMLNFNPKMIQEYVTI